MPSLLARLGVILIINYRRSLELIPVVSEGSFLETIATEVAPYVHLLSTKSSAFVDRFHYTSNLAMPATTAETLSLVTRTVSVAPLVLLSAADHFGRSGKGLRKRVVGVLLGQNDGQNVRVSNSFAGQL